MAKDDIKFSLIGNINAITYKEVFPLIKDNKMWLGVRFNKRVNGKNMGLPTAQ
jgi:modification methylase ecoRI